VYLPGRDTDTHTHTAPSTDTDTDSDTDMDTAIHRQRQTQTWTQTWTQMQREEGWWLAVYRREREREREGGEERDSARARGRGSEGGREGEREREIFWYLHSESCNGSTARKVEREQERWIGSRSVRLSKVVKVRTPRHLTLQDSHTSSPRHLVRRWISVKERKVTESSTNKQHSLSSVRLLNRVPINNTLSLAYRVS
jgi:hypothetical protein